MLTLKTYQQTALDMLVEFLTATRSKPVTEAYAASLAQQGRFNEPYQALLGF